MSNRKFSGARLYKLLKTLVITVTVLSGLYAAYALYLLESNSILNRWESYCSKYTETMRNSDCMFVGFGQINDMSRNFYVTTSIAIVLPLVFFGGGWIYRYIFPNKNQAE